MIPQSDKIRIVIHYKIKRDRMKLWNIWYDLVNHLSGAFSRKRTFYWMVVILIGFTIKFDFLGVTSLARGAGLLPNYYTCMLNFFSSEGVNLELLLSLWLQLVFLRFDNLVKLNNRHLIVADGIKIGKEGKKMPSVKWLHQDSDSNSKAQYIMGHSLQAIAILAKSVKNYFAIPLTARIHEGIRFDVKDKSTLLDKLFELLLELNLPGLYYLVVDKYYCSGRLMKKLVEKDIHMITMMKKNAVAYYPVEEKKKGRGRPKKYGEKVKLFSLFDNDLTFLKAPLPTNTKQTIEYCVVELLWRPLGEVVQFVLTKHPARGNAIVMSTDLSISPMELVLAYSLRFKIEVLFKQAIHQIGTFMYRFWLKAMASRKRGKASGDWLIHFSSAEFKTKIANKIHAYHLFIQLGLIAQGLMQYLSMYHYTLVWRNFGSWLRTIRDNTLPSEKVVALALSKTYFQFLVDETKGVIFKKFIRDRCDISQLFGHSPSNKQAA